MITKKRNIVRLAFITALILLVPFIAMQITDEVVWGFADFIVAGALLFGTGLAYELVAKKIDNVNYRIVFGVALVSAFLLVWAQLAVGLI